MTTFKPTFLAVTLFILVAVSSAAPNNQKLGLKIPDECKGKGFCNIKPEGYDEMQELIGSLLTPMFIAQNLGDRIGNGDIGLSAESDWDNCPTRKTVYESSYVYSSSNDTEPDYIIQHKLLRQPIEMIDCAFEKIDVGSTKQCFKDKVSEFTTATCVSSSTERILYVFDNKTKIIGKKPYLIPCCCHCMVQNN